MWSLLSGTGSERLAAASWQVESSVAVARRAAHLHLLLGIGYLRSPWGGVVQRRSQGHRDAQKFIRRSRSLGRRSRLRRAGAACSIAAQHHRDEKIMGRDPPDTRDSTSHAVADGTLVHIPLIKLEWV